MILRLIQSPAVLFLGAALVATSALSQATPPTPAQTAAPAQQPKTPTQNVVLEDILARVNDQIISRSDYERADQQLAAEVARNNGDVEARRKDLLRDLIDQQLLLSKGKELGITGETELIKQLDEIRKQNHLESMEDLEKAAKAQGVSFEDFKQNQRNAIITRTVVGQEVEQHIQQPPPSEIERYYQAHKAEFDQPETVRLSEILIPTAEGDDAAKVATAEAKANEIVAKLESGADFAGAAKSSSSGPTAQQGGDLGTFRRGSLAKTLEDTTFAMDAGQTTGAIRTKQGFVILKVTEHARGGAAAMEAIKPQVEEAVFMERMQPALRRYMTKLREEAFVDIKPGFVDTGASAKQTKPIYSAYTPPPVKKKKKVATRYRQATFHRPARGNAAPDAAPDVAGSGGAGAAATATASAKTKGSRSNPPAMKAGKKEKIRFGQAPRETLPVAAGETEHLDAGAAPAAPVQQAEAEEPANPLEKAAPAPVKKRFSDRAKLHKVKTKGPRADPFAPPPPTEDETLAEKTQAAPMGLGGDTSKKPKKAKSTGDKVRYSETAKPASPAEPPPNVGVPVTPPATTPATPPEAAPAPSPQP